MKTSFPTYQTEKIARSWGCFHCCKSFNDGSKLQVTDYPTGKYTIKCNSCNMNTWFDLEMGVTT